MDSWRLLDTKARTAAENIALDDALLEARAREESPDTVRFLQYTPHAVLIGIHQAVEQEVREEYCRRQGIDVNRRITGGGAIYFDESQLGWEVIAAADGFPADIGELYERMSEPVVTGLKKLGVKAEFRPRNDIEVKGRKISGTGGTRRRNAFLFQGTLLVDFDVEAMLRSLRIPVKKLADKEIDSVRKRVTCLRELMETPPTQAEIKDALTEGYKETFNITLEKGKLTGAEEELLKKSLEKTSSRKWVYGTRTSLPRRTTLHALRRAPGGILKASLVVKGSRIQSALITGDIFAFPARAIFDLEARLKDAKAEPDTVEEIVGRFYKEEKPEIPGVTADDIAKVLCEALAKQGLKGYGLTAEEANSIHTVNGSFQDIIAGKPGLLLLPYCSKKFDCGYRSREGCGRCGDCAAGEVYVDADARGLDSIGVCSFEHLMETLEKQKEKGVQAYVGFCCEAFIRKHQHELEETGLKGILIDIEGDTCYDLGLEQDAYLGEYKNQTQLKVKLIEKILALAHPATDSAC